MCVVGFAIGAPVTYLLIRLGTRLGTMDSQGSRGHVKAVLRPVPNIGGVAIFAGVVLPLIAGLAALHVIDWSVWAQWLPGIEPHRDRIVQSTPLAIGLICALTALHVMGVVDDRRALPAAAKLAVQVLAAAVLVIFLDVRLLELLGPVPSIALTMLWIIGVTNALNFMDNMDGLAGGVAVVAGGLFMIAALVNQQWFIAAVLALMVGATSGFLCFNFPPARIFMGDGGSMVLGFLLAVMTVRTTFYDPETVDGIGSVWYGLFMPVVVLAVPLYDFCTVTFIRLRQGRSPFVGDQQHFSHRLVQRGLSRRGAVLVIWGLTAVTGIGGVSLGQLRWWQAILVGVQTLLVLLVLGLLEHASRGVRASNGAAGTRDS